VAHACNPSYQEAKIRITVQSQPRQIICEALSQKNPSQNKTTTTNIYKYVWAGGVAQGVGPEFKPQYHLRKKKKN
jgi:hypothetical protein